MRISSPSRCPPEISCRGSRSRRTLRTSNKAVKNILVTLQRVRCVCAGSAYTRDSVTERCAKVGQSLPCWHKNRRLSRKTINKRKQVFHQDHPNKLDECLHRTRHEWSRGDTETRIGGAGRVGPDVHLASHCWLSSTTYAPIME
jgi:hypothetical protein